MSGGTTFVTVQTVYKESQSQDRVHCPTILSVLPELPELQIIITILAVSLHT